MEATGASTTPDPMRHHRRYGRGRQLVPLRRWLRAHGARRRGRRERDGDGRVRRDRSAIILGWVLINGAIPYLEHTVTHLAHGKQFDPEPWILLNLIFSGVAFYTGALVIIAQKAQTRTDKANEEASARHRDEISQAQTDLLTAEHGADPPDPRDRGAAEDADRGGARGNLPRARRLSAQSAPARRRLRDFALSQIAKPNTSIASGTWITSRPSSPLSVIAWPIAVWATRSTASTIGADHRAAGRAGAGRDRHRSR